MRILSLRFANLASLVGEWSIDFDSPAFTTHGIFAITGPTGAGKSTLLDAICLALYARTPRLKDISSGENAILSHHCRNCFAEVRFQTSQGRFVSRWTQDYGPRANKLRSPKHILVQENSDATTTELCSSYKNTPTVVSEVTNLDYARFTRSMLLAQGDFAAFLKADKSERGEILRRITGTEIYTQISKQTYLRYAHENSIRENLSSAVANLVILSPEERESILQRLAKYQTLSEALRARLNLLEEARNRAEQREKLHTDGEKFAQDRADLTLRDEAFQPQAEQLRLAMAALELEGAYSVLIGQRQHLVEARNTHSDLQKKLPSLLEAEQTAKNTFATTSQALAKAENDKKQADPLLAQVIELDRNIADKNTASSELQATVTSQRTELDALKTRQDADKLTHQTLSGTLKDLEAQLEATHAHAPLSETLSGLQVDAHHIQERSRTRDATEAHLAAAVARCAKAREAQKQAIAAQEKVRNELKPVQEKLTAAAQQRSERLASLNQLEQVPAPDLGNACTLALWRDERSALTATGNTLKELLKTAQELGLLARRQTALEAESSAFKTTLDALNTSLRVDEALLPELEKQVTLLDRVRSLEKHRESLQPGVRCPLCGGLEHAGISTQPTAADTERNLDQARQRLADARLRLKEHQEAIKKTEVSKAAKDTELQQVIHQHAALLAQLHTHLAALQESAWQPPSLASYVHESFTFTPQHLSAFCEQVTAGLLAARERYGFIDKAIKDIEALDSQLAKLHADAEKAATELHKLALAQQTATADLDRTADDENRLRAELRAQEEWLFTAVNAFNHAVLPFDKNLAGQLISLPAPINACPPQTSEGLSAPASPLFPKESALSPLLDALLNTLREFAQTYARRVRERTAATTELTALAATIEQRATAIKTDTERLGAAEILLAGHMAELKTLRATRRERFGEASPEAESQRLERALTIAAADKETARAALEQATRTTGEHQARLTLADTALQSAQQEAATGEAAFTERLAATPFADEAAFCAARLPEEQRLALQKEEAALRDEHARMENRAETLRQAREELEAKAPLADVPLPACPLPGTAPENENDADESDNTPEIPASTPLELWSLDALNAERTALEARHLDLQRESGALSQKIADDTATHETRAAKEAALQEQHEYTAQWKVLNGLIGQADGAAYSTFVQNITFAALVDHANVHLGRMTDRYTLWPNPKKAMELCVADHYQASELRTTANLSGGETFIVSLALALGLSDMASRHTSVDSLFLDEGFGTLDAEALNMALEVLGTVQRTGKLIGIISHVPGLQDRIPVRIEVTPRSGGRSELSGPGINSRPENSLLKKETA